MAARIRRQAPRQVAPSAISSRHGIVAAGRQIHVQQGVEIGRTSDLFLAADMVDEQGLAMFASQAALFPLQRDSFSCRNTHAFQQILISAKLLSVFILPFFPLLQDGLHANVSLPVLSFHASSRYPYSCPSIERQCNRDIFRLS